MLENQMFPYCLKYFSFNIFFNFFYLGLKPIGEDSMETIQPSVVQSTTNFICLHGTF